MKYMYRTINPLSKSYIFNESTKSKDQIIEELKRRIESMEDDAVRKCNESIHQISINIELNKKLQEANATMEQLLSNNKYLQQDRDFYAWSCEELKSKVEQLEEALASSEYGIVYEKKIRKLENEIAHYQRLCEKMERELRQEKQVNTQSHTEFDFFKNCDNLRELTRRKKALISIYHPDSGCGDNEITLLILSAYNKKKMGYQ